MVRKGTVAMKPQQTETTSKLLPTTLQQSVEPPAPAGLTRQTGGSGTKRELVIELALRIELLIDDSSFSLSPAAMSFGVRTS